MRLELERELMQRIRAAESPGGVIADMVHRGDIKNSKQGWRTLEKWTDKGWYEYGVSVAAGWLTTEAPNDLPPRADGC